MRSYLFFILVFFFNVSYACHTTSIDAVSIVNNNNGTRTFTIDFTVGVGSMDGYNYGFALIFSGNAATPIVQTTPAFTPSYNYNGETLYGYTGTNIGTGNGTTYFGTRYGGRTDVLCYEYDGNWWFSTSSYSGTIVVTVKECVEYIDIDGDFRSVGTSIGNTGCVDQYGTNINCCQPTAGVFDTTICNGASLLYNGTIYNGSNASGIETLVNKAGCDSFVTVTVTEQNTITNTLDTTLCSGASFVLNGVLYDINNSSGVQTLTAANGCDSLLTVNVGFTSTIVTSFDTTICNGASFMKNGVLYDSTNLSTSNLFLSSGGCDSLSQVNVTHLPLLKSTLDTTICSGTSFHYYGNVFDENNLNDIVILTSQNQCDSVVTVSIDIRDLPDVSVVADPVLICYGQESVLNASGAETYQWEDNSNESSTIIYGESSRDYYVTGYDDIGCSSIASVGIDVKDCSSIFLPSAFSPNGDGNNDEYIVYADVQAIELMIFNRWGEKVFETKDINQSWDGTYKGKILGPSVYVYLCRVENYGGEVEIKKGNITLFR